MYSGYNSGSGISAQSDAYAEPDRKRVVLTFLSEVEIRDQAVALCQRLGLAVANIRQPDVIELLDEVEQALPDAWRRM